MYSSEEKESILNDKTEIKTKIECLVDIKIKLQYLVSHDHKDKDLQNICEKVVQYIQSNCRHHIIEDYIDMDHENSTKIKYCETCLETFP